MPLLNQIREEKLIQLARERFSSYLSDAEKKVLHDSASSEDPPVLNVTAPGASVRADFLRWLATDPDTVPHIDPKGLRVYAATIPGTLDLTGCHIAVSLDFRWCNLKGEVVLESAKAHGISLADSLVEGEFSADWIDASGPVLFRRSSFAGKISLIGARIKNDLNFSGAILRVNGGDALVAATASIGGSLFLAKGVECFGAISLQGTRIERDLVCSGAKLSVKEGDALTADSIEVGGNVFLDKNFASSGLIRLLGARIKGHLVCSGAKLEVKQGDALMLDSAEIGGSVLLRQGFEPSGLVRLGGARINGDLSCSGAKLGAKEGGALLADSAEIDGNVLLRGSFESSGAIRFVSAQIGGDLDLLGAKVAEVNCKNMSLSRDFLWMGIRTSNSTFLNLSGAELKNLCEDRESWPKEGCIRLDGLVYEKVALYNRPTEQEIKEATADNNPKLPKDLKLNADDRVEWLMRQPVDGRNEPQPWVQLSKHLEAKGDRKGAKHVIFKFRCSQAQESWTLWRWRKIAFAWLEEDLLRILLPISCALLLGTLVFAGASRSGAMIETVQAQPAMIATYAESAKGAPRKPDESNKPVSIHYTAFQPFIYTLENAVPLVKLGMDERWTPDLQHQPQPWFPRLPMLDGLKWFNSYGFLVWSRWLLILSGWFQATVLAAALADRFKK